MNVSANGFSVGNLATVTISGTLPYHNNLIDRNGQINLYLHQTNQLIYCWFISSATVYNNSSLNFSGVDVMAYVNNNYAISWTETSAGVTAYDSIGDQFQTAAQTVSDLLPSMSVTIQPNSNGTVNAANQGDFQSTWSIKSLLEASAKFDAVNYYTVYSDVSHAVLTKTSLAYTTVSDYAPLTVGAANPSINRVMVSPSDNSEKVYDYTSGGGAVTPAGTMKIVTPFTHLCQLTATVTNPDSGRQEVVNEYPVYIEPTNCRRLLGMGIGRVFSCQKVYVGTATFFTPMTYLYFSHDTYATNQFVLTHAQYQLTTIGIYANVSGTTKTVSDFDFVGTTEKRVRDKMNMNQEYSGIVMQSDGLYLVPTIPPREVSGS